MRDVGGCEAEQRDGAGERGERHDHRCLAREVARAHGGDLRLVEEVETGACFEMWLPIDDSPIDPRADAPRDLGLASMQSFEFKS